jgi:hypothetical protein
MMGRQVGLCVGCWALAASCGGEGNEPPNEEEPTLLSSVPPITDPALAKPRTYVPAFVDCRPPSAASATSGLAREGQVCTPVSISGCTAEGLYFPDQASCAVVRTQRPYWPGDPANVPNENDPRLNDAAFKTELAWVTQQIAGGCAARITASAPAR